MIRAWMARACVAGVCAASLAGCGIMIDGAYLLGDRKRSDVSEETAPTSASSERTELEAVAAPANALALRCYRRTRGVERHWSVFKTYRRRGSYGRDAYTFSAIIDGVIGGSVAAVILAACSQDDAKLSCKNALYATPFAIDLGYSLIRLATRRPDVLIEKSRSTASLRFAETPLNETETECESIASVWLGEAMGPSDEQELGGQGGGQTRTLREGAIPLHFDAPDAGPPETALTAEAAVRWADQPRARVWALDARGIPHEVKTDRCEALRPHAHQLEREALKRFDTACPLKRAKRAP